MSTPTKAPYNVFIDSDGVLVDFEKMMNERGMKPDHFKYEPGAYLYLDWMPGAEEALAELKKLDDADEIRVWVATKTPKLAPYAYSEKVLWYRWNKAWLEDRVILAHDKSQLGCQDDILVDDRPHKGNASLFRGTFIHFGSDRYPTWTEVLARILEVIEYRKKLKESQYGGPGSYCG